MTHRAWGFKVAIAGLGALAIAMSALSVGPADAAPKKKRAAAKKVYVQPSQPPRSRIVVQPRSYLDAGTYVQPGERKFMDYAIPPNYNPASVFENKGNNHRSPLPLPFELPGGYGGMW
jgi:hypothetical protein